MNPLIPKARRPKFELTLRILDLNNIPLSTGTSHIKYSLPTTSTSTSSGSTPSVPITHHTCTYAHTVSLPIRLSISKSNALLECPLVLETLQDFSSHHHGKADRVTLGSVVLNLAEYVEESEAVSEDEGVVRRYLLRDSKVNSTLRVGIYMRFLEGERGFVAPALKSAAVFGGIAGVVSGDEEVGHLPNLNISKARENSELHDIYRRSLAASWAAQEGELPADECIEDLFNGGDGFLHSHPHADARLANSESLTSLSSEDHGHGHARHHSASSQHSSATVKRGHRHKHSAGSEMFGGKFGKKLGGELMGGADGTDERGQREVDEFEVREDLVAWRLPGGVKA